MPDYQFAEKIPDWDDSGTTHPEEMVLITQNLKEVKQIMTNYVGIVRSDLRLERATARLEIIYRETEALYRKSKVSLQNLPAEKPDQCGLPGDQNGPGQKGEPGAALQPGLPQESGYPKKVV